MPIQLIWENRIFSQILDMTVTLGYSSGLHHWGKHHMYFLKKGADICEIKVLFYNHIPFVSVFSCFRSVIQRMQIS